MHTTTLVEWERVHHEHPRTRYEGTEAATGAAVIAIVCSCGACYIFNDASPRG